ncbi:MAG: response regulator [Deltaproteobacteria bacterium]|nr:response regulator [Deltaproteobacteria bacterium]
MTKERESVVGPERRELSILAVEDDHATREFLRKFINRKFPENPLYLAENGNKGIELFKVHSPGIVITDVIMPEMDGVEMSNAIKMLQSDVKLIVLTGYGSSSYHEIFGKIGVSAFLTKPINLEILSATIQQCLDEMKTE